MRLSSVTPAVFSFLLIAPGCGGDSSPAPKTSVDAKKTSGETNNAAPSSAAIDTALTHYEALRKKLAADDGALATDAKALADAARSAKLDGLAKAADALAGMPAADLGALRKQYGEVSKAVVSLIAADAGLQSGRHLYECPMAEGYKKWVQVDAKMANPYMGTKMLECGSKSDWKV